MEASIYFSRPAIICARFFSLIQTSSDILRSPKLFTLIAGLEPVGHLFSHLPLTTELPRIFL
jgi:hypothetical protein